MRYRYIRIWKNHFYFNRIHLEYLSYSLQTVQLQDSTYQRM